MKIKSWKIKINLLNLQLIFILNHILQVLLYKFQKFKHRISMKKQGLKSQLISVFFLIRSQRSFKLLKDQKLDTHLCSDRSESSFKHQVLQTPFLLSVNKLFVSTTLITLIKVHLASLFIFSYLCHVKMIIYAGLRCMNISELILYVLRISYWWDIRAIYRQNFKIFICKNCLQMALIYYQ